METSERGHYGRCPLFGGSQCISKGRPLCVVCSCLVEFAITDVLLGTQSECTVVRLQIEFVQLL